VSGRRYIAGKPIFMGAFKKKALDAIKSNMKQAMSTGRMGGLRSTKTFLTQQEWDDIKTWSNMKQARKLRQPLPPTHDFRFVHVPRTELARPGGELFFPRDVGLWVSDSVYSLRPRVESHEDYRIRIAEDIVEFGGERNALEKFRDGRAGDERRARGMALALNPNIKHVDLGLWQVPSHSENKPCVVYDVDLNAKTCTCLDHQKRKKKCKHIYAVEYLQSKTSMWQSEHMGTWTDSADRQASMAASFMQVYGSGFTKMELAGFDLSKVQSGRFSTSKPNLSSPPRSGPQPAAFIDIDFSELETRLAASLGITPITHIHKDAVKHALKGVKVTSFIHDEIILEVEVAPPTPADAITLKVPV
jgi:SWIM zinc finger